MSRQHPSQQDHEPFYASDATLSFTTNREEPDHVRAIERCHGVREGAIESFAFAQPQIEDVTTGRISRAAWVEMIAQRIGSAAAAAEWGSQPSRVDPNVLQLAAELRDAGIVTAILTNGTDTIPAEAAELGLVRYFDPIFHSAAIGYIKPDKRVFLHVLDRLGLEAHEVFFTDDSERKLHGARSCGMHAHHFTGIDPLRAALARYELVARCARPVRRRRIQSVTQPRRRYSQMRHQRDRKTCVRRAASPR